MKTFQVTMIKASPAWDEKDGIPCGEYSAETKRDAIKWARRDMENAGHAVGGNGRYWFKAQETEAA